jgi:hypothetical protein
VLRLEGGENDLFYFHLQERLPRRTFNWSLKDKSGFFLCRQAMFQGQEAVSCHWSRVWIMNSCRNFFHATHSRNPRKFQVPGTVPEEHKDELGTDPCLGIYIWDRYILICVHIVKNKQWNSRRVNELPWEHEHTKLLTQPEKKKVYIDWPMTSEE